MSIAIANAGPRIKQNVGKMLGQVPVFERKFSQRLPHLDAGLAAQIYMMAIEKFKVLYGKRGINAQNPYSWRRTDCQAIDFAKFCCELLVKTGMVEVVEKLDLRETDAHVPSDFGTLKKVYMCFPHMLDWRDPINEREKERMANKPDRLIAVLQHFNLIATLIASGTRVYILSPEVAAQMDGSAPRLPEATYTRDVLLVGERFTFGTNMCAYVRQPEMGMVTGADIVLKRNLKFEGGDFFYLGDGKWLASTGDRTTMAAITKLESMTGHTMHVVHKKRGILHVDCAAAVIPNGNFGYHGAFIDLNAFERNGVSALPFFEKMFGAAHELEEFDVDRLGPNIFWLNRGLALLNWGCDGVCEVLKRYGKTIIEINLSQILRGDGSARCATAPLERDKN